MSKQKKLTKINTRASKSLDKKEIKKENIKLAAKIGGLQYQMAAEAKHSILVILQGMDASGKDGATRHVFSDCNPNGCEVQSFKVPSSEELSHDFLWRVHKYAPAKGMIQVFNRSHYEDIMVPVLNNTISKKDLKKRFDHINDFEELLSDNDTTVIKIYLHVSSEEQRERLQERMTNPKKHWKHNPDDRNKADRYKEMLGIYDDIFDECDRVPRHVVSADQNRNKVNQISKIVLKALEDMELTWPKLEEGE